MTFVSDDMVYIFLKTSIKPFIVQSPCRVVLISSV